MKDEELNRLLNEAQAEFDVAARKVDPASQSTSPNVSNVVPPRTNRFLFLAAACVMVIAAGAVRFTFAPSQNVSCVFASSVQVDQSVSRFDVMFSDRLIDDCLRSPEIPEGTEILIETSSVGGSAGSIRNSFMICSDLTNGELVVMPRAMPVSGLYCG